MAVPARRSRVDVGAASVTYLPDGSGVFDPAVVFPPSRGRGWAQESGFLDADGRLTMSFGAFLIRTGSRCMLVDLAMGPADFAIPELGRVRGGELLSSLADEGLAPTDIDTVVFTHLHPDHVGWTTSRACAPEQRDRAGQHRTHVPARPTSRRPAGMDAHATVAGGHFSGQVFGTVRASETGRWWTPLAPRPEPAGRVTPTRPEPARAHA